MRPALALGNKVPADVVKRYALTETALADDSAFHSHVDAVVKFWRSKKQKRTYAKLAESLLVAHGELQSSGGLERNTLKAQREAAAKSALDHLRRQIQGIADTTTIVTRRTMEGLIHASDGFIDESTVRQALAEKAIRVADARPLPTSPPEKYGELRARLSTLGLRLSLELLVEGADIAKGFAILDGFSLNAKPTCRLDAGLIEDARRKWEPERLGDRKSAAERVLTMLAEAATQARLDALLLWELIEVVRPLREKGLPFKVLVAELRDWGLVAEDAELLVLSLLEGPDLERPPPVVVEIEDALACGELRRAEQLAANADATDERVGAVVRRVSVIATRIEELARQAEGARRQGDTESAALLLTEAADTARDDDELQRRADSIAPPSPNSARVLIDGEGVVVTWAASAARLGEVRYRVVRQRSRAPTSPSDGAVVADTSGVEAHDNPPAGQPVFYSVFASRMANVWSTGTTVGPVTLTPEVSDVRVTAGDHSVAISWRVHPDATAVHVVRRADVPPGSVHDGDIVSSTSSLVGLTDERVQPGTAYYYRVSAVYVGWDGARLLAPGHVVVATPEYQLAPVRDLTTIPLEHTDPNAIQLEWTQPPHGLLVIRSASRPPAWSVGARISLDDVSKYGRLVPATPELRSGPTARALVIVQGSRSFLTPFTCGQHAAVVGNSVEVCVASPVRALTAERFGDAARLSWIWPDGATSATVEWRLDGGGTERMGSVNCLRQAYELEGGFEVVVGPRPVLLSVQAVINQPDGPVRSPPAQVRLAMRSIPVRYRFVRSGWKNRSVLVELSADEPCDVPPIVAIHRPGKVMPRSPSEGTVLAKSDAITLDGVLPTRWPPKPVKLRRGLPQGWLVCFVESPSTTVRLIAPSAEQLKVG